MDDATNSAAPATADSGQAGAEVATTGDSQSDTQTSQLGDAGNGGSETTTAVTQAEPGEGDDLFELEWDDGQKYKIPSVLKEGVLRQADYTRKTQEVAEQRRAYEAEQAKFKGERDSFSTEKQRHEATIKGVHEIMRFDLKVEALDDRIAQYDKLDWQKLHAEDPDKFNLYRFQRDQLREQREALRGQRNSKAAEIERQWDDASREAAEKAKHSQANAHEVLSKSIPKWSQETSQQITDYAVANFGFSREELRQVTDPRLVVLAHYARLGKMAEKNLRSPAPVKGQQQKPVTNVAGSKSSSGDPLRDDQSAEQWIAARNKQIFGR